MTNDELLEQLLSEGLFSEYLPKVFNTKKLTQAILKRQFKIHLTKPDSFSMWKGNNYDRRYIYIPNVFSFLRLITWIKENPNIMNELINKNLENNHSLSKISINNKLRNFNIDYPNKIPLKTGKTSNNDFLSNLNIKMQNTNGCNCILHLDIANFFGSIYTHFFTSITKGIDWAQCEYEKGKNKGNNEYKNLDRLDKCINQMNRKRTHGILCGPPISFVMAEFLQTQIDKDLDNTLQGTCNFTRFVDDYDFFIKDKKDIELVKSKVVEVLNNYGLSLNINKTEIEDFPFYSSFNYDEIKCTNDIMHDYSRFATIEKIYKQKGGLYYFVNKIISNTAYDEKTVLPIVLNIIKNVPEAMVRSCNYFLQNKDYDKNQVICILQTILEEFVDNECHLESIWITYLILKIDNTYQFSGQLITKMNDLSKLILYSLSQNNNNKKTVEEFKSDSWLFNYELFFNDKITEENFKENLNLSEEIFKDYKYLKSKKINFIDVTL